MLVYERRTMVFFQTFGAKKKERIIRLSLPSKLHGAISLLNPETTYFGWISVAGYGSPQKPKRRPCGDSFCQPSTSSRLRRADVSRERY